MGLTRAEQADVNMLYHIEGTQTAMMKCFQIWKQYNPAQSSNLQSSTGYCTDIGERRHS